MTVSKAIIHILITILVNCVPLKVMVVTQNQGGIIDIMSKEAEDKKSKKTKTTQFQGHITQIKNLFDENEADILIYNVQELIELKLPSIYSKTKFLQLIGIGEATDLDTLATLDRLKELLKVTFPETAFNYSEIPNITMLTIYIYKKNIPLEVKDIGFLNSNGFLPGSEFNGGSWGQKGGVMSVCLVHNLMITNVNLHLPSGNGGAKDRQAILTNLVLTAKAKENELTQGTNYKKLMILTGDFNSRLSKQETTEMKTNKKKTNQEKITYYKANHANEEFKQKLAAGGILARFKENAITFNPTYKLKLDYNGVCATEDESKINYNKCYKDDIAYTDRVFVTNDAEVNVLKYDTINNVGNFSDHLGVFAIIQVEINIAVPTDTTNTLRPELIRQITTRNQNNAEYDPHLEDSEEVSIGEIEISLDDESENLEDFNLEVEDVSTDLHIPNNTKMIII